MVATKDRVGAGIAREATAVTGLEKREAGATSGAPWGCTDVDHVKKRPNVIPASDVGMIRWDHVGAVVMHAVA